MSRIKLFMMAAATLVILSRGYFHRIFRRSQLKISICHQPTGTIRKYASSTGTSPKSTKSKRQKVIGIADLSLETAEIELRSLNAELNKHDELYYNKCEPEISDAAYDKLLRRAEDIVGKFESLRNIVQKLDRVGTSRNFKFLPFIHSRQMMSLENAFTNDEISKFISRFEGRIQTEMINANVDNKAKFVVEPKIDGLSLAIRYKRGSLQSAGTRGDGYVGEDVTENVKHVIGIPHQIVTDREFVEVRGMFTYSHVIFSHSFVFHHYLTNHFVSSYVFVLLF